MSENLNTFDVSFVSMSHTKNISISKSKVPINAVLALAVIFVFGLFVVGFDQGHLFSIVQGVSAFDESYLHELTHDMRHAAGFPCH